MDEPVTYYDKLAYTVRARTGRVHSSRFGLALLVPCLAVMGVVSVFELAADERIHVGSIRLLPVLLILNVAIVIDARSPNKSSGHGRRFVARAW